MSGAKHRAELPLLVLGPAVGSSATTLWSACAADLADSFDLLAVDLPGQGYNVAPSDEAYSTAELAHGVLAVVDDVLTERGELDGPFAYAGVGVGGAVGSQLQLDASERVSDVVPLGDLDPTTSPDGVARLIRQQLLGEERSDDGLDARDRLLHRISAEVNAARAAGVPAAEIRELLRQVEETVG
jgi:3-oxoadipate enol-lactonase/4-carboxymuconolactone decarboxylase